MTPAQWRVAPIGKFWWLVGYTAAQNPDWRAGQTTFNVLAAVRPDLSERIRGTAHDAFHHHAGPRLDDMCVWIEDNWQEEGAV